MSGEDEINIGHLRLTQDDKAYLEHKMCFRQCINNMELNSLNAEEHECVKNCLFRYNATERVVLDKIRYVMGQWVNQDPSLRAAYMAQNKGK